MGTKLSAEEVANQNRERIEYLREHVKNHLKSLRERINTIPTDPAKYELFREVINRDVAVVVNGTIAGVYAQMGFSNDPKKNRKRYQRALRKLESIADRFDEVFQIYEEERLGKQANEYASQHTKPYKDKRGKIK